MRFFAIGRTREFDTERRTTKPVQITINTRVPSKWRFVDLETGEVWASFRGKMRLAGRLPQGKRT